MTAITSDPVPPTVFQFQDLSVTFTTAYDTVWDDSGSGADMDGSAYRPKAGTGQDGYFPLGDYMIGASTDSDPNGTSVSLLVKDLGTGTKPALAAPTGVAGVYHGEVYMLQAPDGYRALGGVAVYEDQPVEYSQYRCVRNDLLVDAIVGPQIYNDHGTGRSDDLSTYQVQPPAPTIEQPGTIYLSPGTFLPSPSLDGPDQEYPPYALQLNVSDTLPAGPEPVPTPPKLTSYNPAPPFGQTIKYTTFLPWFAVADANMPEAQRIVDSPVYRLERTDVYKLLISQYNNTSKDQVVSYTVTTGASHEKTNQFSHMVGVELGAEYSVVPEVFKVSAKLTYQFTYTTSTSDTMEESESYAVNLTIPSQTNAAVYMINSTYELRRQDGSLVTTVAPVYGRPNTTYSTQYPPVSDGHPALEHSAPQPITV